MTNNFHLKGDCEVQLVFSVTFIETIAFKCNFYLCMFSYMIYVFFVALVASPVSVKTSIC